MVGVNGRGPSKNPRRLRRVIAAGVLVVSAGAASGLTLSKVRAASEFREAKRQAAIREMDFLIQQYRDTLWRHPDLPLQQDQRYLASVVSGHLTDRAAGIDEFSARVVELQRRTALATGAMAPGVAAWDLKSFTPNGFKAFYDAHRYTGVRLLDTRPVITGNERADAAIRMLAERRGYQIRPQADESKLVRVGEHLMQPQIAAAWKELRTAAAEDGLRLDVVSAYRSVARQREIFLYRLDGEGRSTLGYSPTPQQIADGLGNDLIDAILRTSSIPGYSKHHTGYTLDLTDVGSGRSFMEFEHTPGFLWLSERNYLNAKRFGFLPSYPAGADSQGPEPEAWEYVWVGREVLIEATRSPPDR